MKKLFAGIDTGTQGVRIGIVDENGIQNILHRDGQNRILMYGGKEFWKHLANAAEIWMTGRRRL